ncbi:tetratricopeptide repeat protein [Balneolaceae bacterium YR4-1]|uniref:Tetratricopeptide repeat protein n=1 Tax=Halalkalibaculum roseum TaxID=2709311 RepID=A0A6M1SKQ2_9BACT|nr:tetratricopeptide repeat protein [Halalkalibaculum roseum]NGP75891.1 tetratricopeptide repeat protein [Halalkalibaculum roseum]
MFRKFTTYFVITLFVGMIAGCGSSNPFVDDAQSNIKDQNFQAALEAAEQSIQNQPNDPLGYYYKGVALGEIADTKEATARQEYYERMNDAFAQAEEMAAQAEDVPSEIERIPAVKNAVWQTEHNKAIEYASDDSVKNTVDNPLEISIAHLNNATTIQPDSVLSWDVKAQVYYMNDNVEGAVNSMEKVMELKNSLEAEDYARMAGYYSLAEKPQEAIATLENGLEQYPENKDLATRLADGYTNAGQTDKAISTIEALIEQEPENPQFHLVLGTQIYKTVLTMSDTLKANSDQIFDLRQQMNQASGNEASQIKQQISELDSENTRLQQEINSLTERATKELNTVLEYRPNDATAYNTLGIIYQNKASALFDKRNRTDDNQMAAKIDAQAKDALKQAMEYYESAAEIDPDNQEYWKNLFSIYTALGMDQKAEEAMQKAGMN